MSETPAAFQHGHDHARCVQHALAAAAEYCRKSSLRLTPLRRKVLRAVWRSHHPLGAYEICDALVAEGNSVLPPTVYRALDFLERNGLVHRIASLNAFIGCNQSNRHRHGRYLICSDCGSVAELPPDDLIERFTSEADTLEFEARTVRLEAVGRCAACAAANPGS